MCNIGLPLYGIVFVESADRTLSEKLAPHCTCMHNMQCSLHSFMPAYHAGNSSKWHGLLSKQAALLGGARRASGCASRYSRNATLSTTAERSSGRSIVASAHSPPYSATSAAATTSA